jgi:hypothetical protein
MADRTMVARLLQLADDLAEEGKKSSALRRRAVSTAYYAVFHAIAKICADTLLESVSQRSDEYLRIYRALDHGPLKSNWQVNDSPLKKLESLRKIGELVIPLQSERIRADYLPPLPHPFSYSQAKEIVEQAQQAISSLSNLKSDERRTLAVWLLFKVRQP